MLMKFFACVILAVANAYSDANLIAWLAPKFHSYIAATTAALKIKDAGVPLQDPHRHTQTNIGIDRMMSLFAKMRDAVQLSRPVAETNEQLKELGNRQMGSAIAAIVAQATDEAERQFLRTLALSVRSVLIEEVCWHAEVLDIPHELKVCKQFYENYQPTTDEKADDGTMTIDVEAL